MMKKKNNQAPVWAGRMLGKQSLDGESIIASNYAVWSRRNHDFLVQLNEPSPGVLTKNGGMIPLPR